jgi:hypothetical protein
MEKSFRLSFFLKAKKKGPNETPFVFMRITIDGEKKEISTKVECPRELWNQKSGRAIGNKPQAKQLNAYLDSLSLKVLQESGSRQFNRKSTSQLITTQSPDPWSVFHWSETGSMPP